MTDPSREAVEADAWEIVSDTVRVDPAEFARLLRAEADLASAKALLREITNTIDFGARPPERYDLFERALAFLAGEDQQ